jgi:phosphatidate cytidylyltransferase
LNELLKRSLTGFIFVAIMLSGLIIHPYTFAIVFAVLLFLTLSEFYKMSEKIEFRPQKTAGFFSGIFLFLIFFLVANKIIPGQFIFLSLLIPFFIFLPELFGNSQSSFRNSLSTLFGVFYVAVPFSLLNFIIVPGTGNTGFYPWILVGVFLIIWMYDSMAYAFGSLLGKHKISEKISPGKSWEGLIGGSVFAVIMGILNAVLFHELSMLNWIVIALLAVFFGTCGDFFESKLKRETGVKDSGNIMPGHGGMLDRFDSLLFAAPVIFVWLNLFGNI